jgi:uncharacterized protein (DUF58 family)
MCAQRAEETGVYVDLDGLIALEHSARRTSFLPRQPVHSLLAGRYASRMRGRGLNFEEIRDYRPGDDVRTIDWKVTARLQAAHVRVFNEERDRPAVLVIDQRMSMFFGSRLAMKSVTAAEAAAIAAWRVLGGGDRVGGIIFNDSDFVAVRPQRSRRTVLRLLEAMVTKNRQLGVGRGIATDSSMLNRALEQARRLVRHDALMILISDFEGADAETRGIVSALARHNDVVAALVHDPLHSELPPAGRMTVSDGELQLVIDTGSSKVRRDILEMGRTRLKDVLSWTREFGVPVLPLSTADAPSRQIGHLLGQRPSGRHGGAAGHVGVPHG